MTTLAERLHLACDRSKNCPSKSHGRQVWLAETLGYSIPAVNKWFKGHSEPPLKVLKTLAELLEVDPGWLALGIGDYMQKPVFSQGEDYDMERGVCEKVPEASRRAGIVYAWMARACMFGVPFSPVYNRPNVDAVVITPKDCWDVFITELHPVQNQSNAKNFIEFKQDTHNPTEEYNIFKGNVPPKNFSGLVAGMVCYELPRSNQFRVSTFASEDVRERAFETERGYHYAVELDKRESTLLCPVNSGLSPVGETLFRETLGLRMSELD